MEISNPSPPSRLRWLTLPTLVLAGEAIFFLPFVLPRVFRPTLLEVFGITNLQLGWAFSAYGVVAMLSYFPGGPLADRYGPRRLMTIALVSTAFGGVLLATVPLPKTLMCLYGVWGFTTVFLFWAGLIRATRQWGGANLQGSAFGLLDGGRGLVAAVVGSVSVYCYSALLPADIDATTFEQRSAAFTQVIWIFTGVTSLAAAMTWWTLPEVPGPHHLNGLSQRTGFHDADFQDTEIQDADRSTPRWNGLREVARMPTVWLQAVIILCAYVAYKGLDDVSLYAKEALGFDEVSAAYASTLSMWMRPVAAILAGFVADRLRVTNVTALSFLVLTIGSLVIALDLLHPGMLASFFVLITATSAAVFALRGLYFAIMREGKIPLRYTGTAVGIVSAIGYTPDIFMGPLMGVLLDRGSQTSSNPTIGHQLVFAVVAGFSCCGMIATLCYRYLASRAKQPSA
ncbi:MFS transporter [Rhodopirellula sp. SWK7]|uniref:MFS transporter n=1 Tax=Rhodopirellula sp. SWK7 TaxID=595460 RepID=UPI0002BEB5AD|nr:MFS transporter [Rhodopirellula sp. SWK7]EMI42013.1 major facilitator family protein [Rhodopirellula sp. SWK7]